jgi:hypothetical protein
MIHSNIAIALLLGLLGCLAASPALAQSGITQRGLPGPAPGRSKVATEGTAEPAPPPALPGATSTVPPAEKTATDLPPTDALFDAINRGDIASARDALSRGADLSGHNILGMTPLDLSVDLSRNDITFLLLSMRTTAPAAGRAVAVAAAAAPGKSGAAKPAAARFAVRSPIQVAAPPADRQYAAAPADPGTPNPQAGFLGFGRSIQ